MNRTDQIFSSTAFNLDNYSANSQASSLVLMPHSTQFPILLTLPSDTYKVEGNTAVDKSGGSFHTNHKIPPHKHRTPMSHRDNSPSINGQLETVSNFSSVTSPVKSISQFELEDLSTWSRLPNGGSFTSATGNSGNEKGGLHVKDDLDLDEEPRKKQKTQLTTGSTTADGRIRFSDALLVESQDKSPSVVDGEPRELRLHNFGAPEVGLADSHAIHLGITNKAPLKEEKEESLIATHNRKRTNALSGLLVLRSSAMSKSTSTSDSLNSTVFKDYEEPSRRTRGLALRPTNSSNGAKLKKSQGRIADQDELELWTNADVARIKFRKPRLLEEMEEENAKRSVSHILTCLMEIETGRSNENVARNDKTTLNDVQNKVAMPDSSVYARCDDLVEEIFGPDCRNRGMTLLKPKTGLVKQKQSSEKRRSSSSNTDLPIVTRLKAAITNFQQEDGKEIVTNPPANGSISSEAPTTGVDQTINSLVSDVMETREFQVPSSRTSASGDGRQLGYPDVLVEGISHSAEHKLLRRMQNLFSEDVTVLGKRTREEMITGEKKIDMTARYDVTGEDAEEEGSKVDELEMDGDGHEKTLVTDELKPLENPSKAPELTKIVQNIQPVDELGVAITSDIETEEVGNTLEGHCPSIDNNEDQEDEEMRHEANSLQIPLPQLEDWSITLRSLIKGKKRFQHQDLINLKNTLQEIHDNRANISATSSLAQEVYGVSQLGVHEVPNEDELELRALARKSTRYWVRIRRQRDA